MNYIIVSGFNLTHLEEFVNKKIEEGYIPIGNPFYKSTIGCEWHQAMILKTCLK